LTIVEGGADGDLDDARAEPADVGGEVVDVDHPLRADHGDALHHVAELADVARPVVAHELGLRLGGDALGRDVCAARHLVEQALGEHRDRLLPLAQRRDLEAQHFEPVEEVGAEPPGRHGVLEPDVGGRDHPEVHLDLDRAADAPELAALDRAQQLGLAAEVHLADLVQEERAAVRGLHHPRLRAVGAGEVPSRGRTARSPGSRPTGSRS
jgi:hypothetical protein